MKRLTTNCPDNNLDAALNLFYIKDFETWVRGGGDGPDYPDIRLYDFIRKAAKILLPDLDFPMDDDGVDYAMGELLLDGPDEPTGLLALLYTAAWSYAELRGRLMQYEDTGLTPEEVTALGKLFDYALKESKTLTEQLALLNRIRDLAEADKDGRLEVLPCKVGDTLYEVTGRKTVSEYRVKAIRVELFCVFIEWEIEKGFVWQSLAGITPNEIGKTVFLTREEAEKALEAMKDG